MVREIGPNAVRAFRYARVSLWRFKRSPEQQDRAAKYATFAFIGFFAIGSVDAIVTGGADFAPHSAYAAEYRPASITTPAPASVLAAAELPTPEDALKAVEVDYSLTTETLLGGPEAELAQVEPAETPTLAAVEGGKFEISKPNAGAALDEPTL